MDYEQIDGGLEARHAGGEGIVVTLRAQNIRQQRTGVHARLTIGVGSTIVGRDLFNVERDAERRKLAGHAFKEARELGLLNGKSYTRTNMEHELMLFTAGLWPEWVGTSVGEWVEGDRTRTEVSWRLQDYIPSTGGTIPFGPKESGKTWLCLLWAASMQWGISKFWDVEQTNVLIINLERSKEVSTKRLGLVNEVLGLDVSERLLMLNRRGKRLADVYDAASNMIQQEGVEHVLLDSLSRGGFGDLNENSAANDAIDGLNGLCASWTAFAHTPRGDDSHVYGSVHFENGCDVLVRVRTELDQETGNRGIGLTAHGNDVPFSPLRMWTLGFDTYGLSSFREAREHEWRDIEDPDRTGSDEDRVFDQMLAYGPQSQKMIMDAFDWDRTRASRAWGTLVRAERIIFQHKDKNEQFYSANSPEEPDSFR